MLEVEYEAHNELVRDHVNIQLLRADGLVVLLQATDDDGGPPTPEVRGPGRYVTRFRFPPGLLNEDAYRFRGILGKRKDERYDDRERGFFDRGHDRLHPPSHWQAQWSAPLLRLFGRVEEANHAERRVTDSESAYDATT